MTASPTRPELKATCFLAGDRVCVRTLEDDRQRAMYSDRPCRIVRFRGDDGPDLEAFIETVGMQGVQFREWFPVADLVKETPTDA